MAKLWDSFRNSIAKNQNLWKFHMKIPLFLNSPQNFHKLFPWHTKSSMLSAFVLGIFMEYPIMIKSAKKRGKSALPGEPFSSLHTSIINELLGSSRTECCWYKRSIIFNKIYFLFLLFMMLAFCFPALAQFYSGNVSSRDDQSIHL